MDIFYQPVTVKVLKRNLLCIGLCTRLEGEGFSIFSRQATRSLVVYFNKKIGCFQSLLMVACIPQVHVYLGSIADQSDWSLVIHFGHLSY